MPRHTSNLNPAGTVAQWLAVDAGGKSLPLGDLPLNIVVLLEKNILPLQTMARVCKAALNRR
jgi:hypothetical protein